MHAMPLSERGAGGRIHNNQGIINRAKSIWDGTTLGEAVSIRATAWWSMRRLLATKRNISAGRTIEIPMVQVYSLLETSTSGGSFDSASSRLFCALLMLSRSHILQCRAVHRRARNPKRTAIDEREILQHSNIDARL